MTPVGGIQQSCSNASAFFYWENGKRIMELDEACDIVNFIHEEYVLISEGLRSLGGDFPEDLGGLPRHEFEPWNPRMPMFAVDLVGVEWASDIHAVVVWGGIKPFLVQRGSFQGVAKCYD